MERVILDSRIYLAKYVFSNKFRNIPHCGTNVTFKNTLMSMTQISCIQNFSSFFRCRRYVLGQTTFGQTNDKPHRLFKHNPAFIIVFRSKYKFKRKLITCDKRTFRNQSAVCLTVGVDSPEQCVCVCVCVQWENGV